MAVILTAVAVVGCGGVRHARIAVSPGVSLRDAPVRIVISGLGDGRPVTVALSSVDAAGVRWASSATFRSDAAGGVDLAADRSVGGSYTGVDAMGLVDSLAPVSSDAAEYIWGARRPTRFDVRVSESGRTLATGSFLRLGLAPGVRASVESIRRTGFDGEYWRARPSRTPRAAVLAFGGSEGGLSGVLLSSGLASAGVSTLDLAYFGEPGLPPLLHDIPLGYFARALRWLARQPGVDPDRIFVSGGSRGSEAALLLAVHYPGLVHGVIASSPSDLSFGAVGTPAPSAQPAWTYEGRPVPFSHVFSSTTPVIDPAAEIAVQRIHAPVLLDCGTADEVWTSCAYASAIMRRLQAAHDPDPHVLYRFIGGGHLLDGLTPYDPTSAPDPSDEGATPLANANADAELWPRLLRFLAHPGGEGTTSISATSAP